MQRRDIFKCFSVGALALMLNKSKIIAQTQESSIPKSYQNIKKIIKPKALKEGDTVGIISAATPAYTPEEILKIEQVLTYFNLKPYYPKYFFSRNNSINQRIEEKASDFNELFANDEIKAIFSIRGGYGSMHILDKIDYKLVEKNPKILIGYSDITALLISIFQKTGLITFHGPMLLSKFTNYTVEVFRGVLFGNSEGLILTNPNARSGIRDVYPIRTLKNGIAQGRLIGGNLSLITAMLGTDFDIQTDGRILFLEDTGEEPYSIDRMLATLALAHKFDNLSGFIWGKCNECNQKGAPPIWDFSIEQSLDYYFRNRTYPSFSGLVIGHTDEQLTLPIGINAEIDASKGSIKFLENAVE